MLSTIWSFDVGKASLGEAVRYVSDDPTHPKHDTFAHAASYLIPEEFAETRTAATRRRMYRTRLAHKAREAWLDAVWKGAGLEPLQKRVTAYDTEAKAWRLIHPADPRLESEFPPKGDDTCYTSCLLRIKLLRGKTLEPWQIYKALHSAIQKRGYGRVPWAARDQKRKQTDAPTEEEQEAALLKKKVDKLTDEERAYRNTILAWGQFKERHPAEYHYPCYYDAEKMGLWDGLSPLPSKPRIDHLAGSTRQIRFDRADVEKEIATLANQAAKQLPALAASFAQWQKEGWDRQLFPGTTGANKDNLPVKAADFGDFLVHGPAGEPTEEAQEHFEAYLRFRREGKIHPGSEDDWMGATAQKTPRFDNRIVNGCALIPRLQVCNVSIRFDKDTKLPHPDSLLATEVTFLMKLKNTLINDGANQRKFSPVELREIFTLIRQEALSIASTEKNAAVKIAQKYAIKASDWGKKKGLKELKHSPLATHAEIKSPKLEGRSRFSRPALRLIRAIILNGQDPADFLRRLLDQDSVILDEIGMDVLEAPPLVTSPQNGATHYQKRPRPWVLRSDLKFLDDLATKEIPWQDFYPPEQKLDLLEDRHRLKDGSIAVEGALRELLGDINDPIVRHRLEVFSTRISELKKRYSTAPAREIVLEFVREDFMGAKAKMELMKFQRDREQDRQKAREEADKLGVTERSGSLKYELFKEQSGICLYCGQDFHATKLAEYEIDHIVPRSQGGPDARINYTLAHLKCNQDKGEQTPYQWLSPSQNWSAYVKLVESQRTALRNKKVDLLLREDAPELVERYTALAETAWIAKLAQKIISLHFGWRNGVDLQGNRRVTILSGGLTGRLRRRYQLNSLLRPMPEKWFHEQWEKTDESLKATPTLQAELKQRLIRQWESEADKTKNRDDDRHHALDAMVINFWNKGAKRQDHHYFRFPEKVHQNARAYFQAELEKVMPQHLFFPKSQLAATIYGARDDEESRTIVQRVSILKMAYKSVGPSKTVYDRAYALKQFKSIRDEQIRQQLENCMHEEPTAEEWSEFCKTFSLLRPDGSRGPLIKKVLINVGKAEEYKDLSKDQTGAWRKANEHQGQIIYLDEKGKPRVRPIYAFESEKKVREELAEQKAKVIDTFRSKCLVQLDKAVDHAKTPLSPGQYILNSIWKTGFVVVTSQSGTPSQPISITKLLEAGFRRL